jgi:hypothetical protein
LQKGISLASPTSDQPDAAPTSVDPARHRIESDGRRAAADPVETRSAADELNAAYALLARRFPDEAFSYPLLLAVGSARKLGAGLVITLAAVLIAIIVLGNFAT